MEVCAPLGAQKPPGESIAKLTEPEERRLTAPAGDLGLRKWITFMGVEGYVSRPLTLPFHIKSLSPRSHTLLEAEISKKGEMKFSCLSLLPFLKYNFNS